MKQKHFYIGLLFICIILWCLPAKAQTIFITDDTAYSTGAPLQTIRLYGTQHINCDSGVVVMPPARLFVGFNTWKAITRAGYSVPYFRGRRYVGPTNDLTRVNLFKKL